MSPDEFALALRVLDAPVFLDNQGTHTPLGVEFTATTSDGKSVFVTQLSAALNGRVTNPDAFVRTLKGYGYQGAGITESGQLYFLELPPQGITLTQRLATSGPVPAAELTGIARNLVDLLRQPALRGEPHGMVTPVTVRLGSEGSLSLRWPGLMAALRAAGVDVASLAGELGIESFVAPEVLRGDMLEVRADIYALGVTLYTALTGRPPFGGRTTATMMAVVLADDGAPLTTLAGILTTVLLRAIEQDPADRWRDLQQFHDALGPVEAHEHDAADRKVSGRRGCAVAGAIFIAGALVLWVAAQYIS